VDRRSSEASAASVGTAALGLGSAGRDGSCTVPVGEEHVAAAAVAWEPVLALEGRGCSPWSAAAEEGVPLASGPTGTGPRSARSTFVAIPIKSPLAQILHQSPKIY
jgi:hypothetical protein